MTAIRLAHVGAPPCRSLQAAAWSPLKALVSELSPTARLAPPPDRVSIAALTLQDLRNHAALEAAFDAPLIVLTGENGAGKTNLLESISLLAPGRGEGPVPARAARSTPGDWSCRRHFRP